jgi:hypothetical protein
MIILFFLALLSLILLVAFIASKLIKNPMAAAIVCTGILFAIFNFAVIYLGHPIVGLAVWHLIGAAAVGGLATLAFKY